MVTVTPASTKARSGCSASDATARVATLDDGQTSSGIPVSARCSSSVGIQGCRGAVADPLRAEQPQGVPDGLGSGGLAGVRHAVQAGRAGRVEVRLELRARHADLGPAEPEPDERVDAVVERVGERRVGRRQPGLAGNVVDPAQHQAEVALGRHPGVLDRLRVRLDRDPSQHRGVRRAGELGVPDALTLRHLASDLVGEVADVVGRADQTDHREVDLDEVREVAEGEERLELVEVARHHARMALGELGDDPGRGRADVVDVELCLRQGLDEVRSRSRRSEVESALALSRNPRHSIACSTAFTAVPGSGCSWSSMKTPGVPLTPSCDIWSVAFSIHCS